uniref:Uncharacterized protein n=1 Tax=Anguilla anguilla TaxID=7936 RepID=A0A0E9R6F8_ANGAN
MATTSQLASYLNVHTQSMRLLSIACSSAPISKS